MSACNLVSARREPYAKHLLYIDCAAKAAYKALAQDPRITLALVPKLDIGKPKLARVLHVFRGVLAAVGDRCPDPSRSYPGQASQDALRAPHGGRTPKPSASATAVLAWAYYLAAVGGGAT